MSRTSLRLVALWVDEGLLLTLSSSIYRSYSRLERYSNEYSDGFGRPIASGEVRLGYHVGVPTSTSLPLATGFVLPRPPAPFAVGSWCSLLRYGRYRRSR